MLQRLTAAGISLLDQQQVMRQERGFLRQAFAEHDSHPVRRWQPASTTFSDALAHLRRAAGQVDTLPVAPP